MAWLGAGAGAGVSGACETAPPAVAAVPGPLSAAVGTGAAAAGATASALIALAAFEQTHDRQFVLKKLGISDAEYEELLKKSPVSLWDFDTDTKYRPRYYYPALRLAKAVQSPVASFKGWFVPRARGALRLLRRKLGGA